MLGIFLAMKFNILCVFLLCGAPVMADEISDEMDVLFDLQIKTAQKYYAEAEEYHEDFESQEVRKFVEKNEKEEEKVWIDILTKIKKGSDLQLKAQMLRSGILTELTSAYYDLEYAEGIQEHVSVRSKIVKWKKHLKQLERIERKLADKSEKTEDLKVPVKDIE